MLKCILIDDDKLSREIIKSMISKNPDLELLAEFESPITAFGFITKHSSDIDFIFLDIHMPEFTGFEFLNSLASPPKVILISSDSDKAIKAFEYDNIVDYLVKPIDFNRFMKSVNKIKKFKSEKVDADKKVTFSLESDELFINVSRRLVKINYSAIDVIEAKGDYIQIHTADKNYVVHSTMKKIESKLPADSFMKVHRSFIINLKKIVDIEDNTVLISQKVIPISLSKKAELMEKLNRL